jgi:UDP:flavonoid glycosyltransferase YjiC (YdhE family)
MNPVLPVLRKLVRRQCEVACYSTEPFRPGIQQAGAAFCDYGPEFRMPRSGPGPFARVSATLEALLALTVAVLEHCLEDARRFRPNLVMFDSFAPWGRLIAQILRLPTVGSIPSILINDWPEALIGRPLKYRPSWIWASWSGRHNFRFHAEFAVVAPGDFVLFSHAF